jgi:hypothetical protein
MGGFTYDGFAAALILTRTYLIRDALSKNCDACCYVALVQTMSILVACKKQWLGTAGIRELWVLARAA